MNWSVGLSSLGALLAMSVCAFAFAFPGKPIPPQPAKGALTPVKVEKLGDEFYFHGTARKAQVASIELLRKQDDLNTLLVMQADHAFALTEKNVDDYLDWYYSLSGEYMRLYKLVTSGQLDAYVREKLIECLQQGKPFDGFDRSLREAASKNAASLKQHQLTVQRILDQNRIGADTSKFLIITHDSADKLSRPSVHYDFDGLRSRLLVSGAKGSLPGSMTSAITGKIMEKVDQGNTLKMAAKTLAKFVVAKATGSLGGASAGAAVGSAVPGIGTAIGAVVGIVVGGAVIDKGFISLDEMTNRQSFRSEIMAAIAEVRRDLVDTMKPEPALFFLKSRLDAR